MGEASRWHRTRDDGPLDLLVCLDHLGGQDGFQCLGQSPLLEGPPFWSYQEIARWDL